ncbi:hypothetical protein GCM10010218_64670 [Streptomyces mashuensis]|uniref:Uncharacterized protein n=1 Tax=Streptomyces mashuensis TaxID=33904 RepID=A0A919BB35_9ACTN|nr:hypothetical protein [Streptomyces mashuensis]GHF74677.1 hypothetical protein GCM10010218_64670 [Streptomyces mashuensis]
MSFDDEWAKLRSDAGLRPPLLHTTGRICRNTLRPLLPVALGVIPTLTACSGQVCSKASASDSPSVEETNRLMRTTSFRSQGDTTALAEEKAEMRWNPEEGLEAVVTSGTTGNRASFFCKKGTTYVSASLLAETQRLTVPPSLSDVYVTIRTGQGCDSYFAISKAAEPASGEDGTVGGKRTRAVVVDTGVNQATYQIAAEGKPYLLHSPPCATAGPAARPTTPSAATSTFVCRRRRRRCR